MEYKIELTEEAEQKTLAVRTTTSVSELSKIFAKVYGDIIVYLNEIGEKPAGVPFAIYYNEDMENLDMEIGFPVAKVIEGKEEIKAGKIPAGKQVSLVRKGAYKDCLPAYEALVKWIKDNNHAMVGSAYEFYINDPQQVPESELLTKIAFPIK